MNPADISWMLVSTALVATSAVAGGAAAAVHVTDDLACRLPEDLPVSKAVKRFPTRGDTSSAWRDAARFGYLHALAKMMTQDARDEREAYGLVA